MDVDRRPDLLEARLDAVPDLHLNTGDLRDIDQHRVVLFPLAPVKADRLDDQERPHCVDERLREPCDACALGHSFRQVGVPVSNQAHRRQRIGLGDEHLLRPEVIVGTVKRDQKMLGKEVRAVFIVRLSRLDEDVGERRCSVPARSSARRAEGGPGCCH